MTDVEKEHEGVEMGIECTGVEAEEETRKREKKDDLFDEKCGFEKNLKLKKCGTSA